MSRLHGPDATVSDVEARALIDNQPITFYQYNLFGFLLLLVAITTYVVVQLSFSVNEVAAAIRLKPSDTGPIMGV